MSDILDTSTSKTLKIGILPRTVDQIRDDVMDVINGRKKRAPDAPKFWFQSISQALLNLNIPLLMAVRQHGPATPDQIAAASGMDPLVTDTEIKHLAMHGFLQLDENSGIASVPWDEIKLIIPIAD